MNYQRIEGHIFVIAVVIHDPRTVGPVIQFCQVTQDQTVGREVHVCTVGVLLVLLDRV